MITKKLVYRTHQIRSGPGMHRWEAQVTFDLLDETGAVIGSEAAAFPITNLWAKRYDSQLEPPADLPEEMFCLALAVVADKIQATNSLSNLSVTEQDTAPGIRYSRPAECVIQINVQRSVP